MPRTRKSTDPPAAETQPSFEQALHDLEAIVENMENEQLPLNELIDQYEIGTRLFTTCNQLLGSARERLELITLKAREDQATHVESPAESDPADEDEPDDDDIRLF